MDMYTTFYVSWARYNLIKRDILCYYELSFGDW